MSRTEIRITGFGGQGVVLSGYIIGRACAIHAGKHATMIQSFGPEARGSACSAMLSVSDTEVLYPYIHRPDIFVVMSSEGYDMYSDELKGDGILDGSDGRAPRASSGPSTGWQRPCPCRCSSIPRCLTCPWRTAWSSCTRATSGWRSRLG